ncbi:MAG: Ig-like domain-containing protein, partial [Bacteroidota bacterium]|nr:Ig-like domain-containing protein [Bacteroidota bacterium]
FKLLNVKFLFFLFIALQISVFSQTNKTSKLPEGYINNPITTPHGIIFTDEHHSTVYLSNNNKVETLFSSPGCGRYLTISKDGEEIGYKSINPNTGLQAPAIYNLKNKKITILEDYTQNAGQVSFADNGTVAYTIGNKLIIAGKSQKRAIDLGTYSNRTPISPDGNSVVFRDKEDQLWLLNLNTGSRKVITDSKDGYANAQWSPDSKSIVYTTNGLKIYTTNIAAGNTYYIGEGENPAWLSNSSQIVFFKKDIDFQKAVLLNSDIFLAGSKGEFVKNITNTPDKFEMEPYFDASSNKIIFQTYNQNEVKSLSISKTGQPAVESVILKLAAPLQVKYYTPETSSLQKSNPKDLPDYVHIHQVLDTREDWPDGYSCCGATSCMQALASFGILPPSPITTHSHISKYGIYISDPYTYNGYTFTGYSGWPSGAHGYMWNGSGSPYSNAVSFLQRHGVSSARTDDVPFTKVTTEIGLGYPYIVCTTQLTAAHIVMIVGQYGTQHSVYCNDPFGDKNAGNYGGLLNGKNAIYDWSDANTGHEKITPVVWAITAHYSQTAPPVVLSYYPSNNQDSVRSTDTVSITFSQQMDKATTEAAFSISPAVPGTIFWSNSSFTLNFKPAVIYDRATQYIIKIDTTAKGLNNVKLHQVLSFTFKTRFRNKLTIEKTYPVDMQTKISPTAQFRFQFDAPVPSSAVVGNFELYDWNNVKQTIANGKIFTQNGKGLVYFEPKVALEKNKNYSLLLKGKICDYEGIPIGDSVIIAFVTDGDTYQLGTVVEGFENVNNWKIQKQGSDLGIDTVATVIVTASDRKISGTYSGKLNFTFTGNNGICQINDLNTPVVGGASGSEFGIWVFGDLSMNRLEYWFNVNGNTVKSVIDTINWTGWKLKRIPLASIGGTGNITFTNIVVRQTSNGVKTGSIYFDDAQFNIVSAVEEQGSYATVSGFALAQNYPNPFNPSTTIRCRILEEGVYTLKIYNLLGQEVAVLHNGELMAGEHKFTFNAIDKPTGVYIYQLRGANVNISHKMMLLK